MEKQVTFTPVQKERKESEEADISIEYFAEFLYGSRLKLWRKAQRLVEDEKLFASSSYYDLPLPEARKIAMAKINRKIHMDRDLGPELRTETNYLVASSDDSFGMRLFVHVYLFTVCIENNASDDLLQQYQSLIDKTQIFGCFAMTELGNGSNIPALETTATFDPSNQTFIIHTPTITATKWWIGGAAETATHAVVFADLVTKQQHHGAHIFLVQLRDHNGKVKDGIEIGDMGPKFGRNGTDNGWIRFHQYRIPRTNMLMKWAQVDEQGNYHPPTQPQMAYAALLGARTEFLGAGLVGLSKAVIIAARYGVERVAFDRSIMDFQTHQAKLIPILATIFGMNDARRVTLELYTKLKQDVSQSNFKNLSSLHAHISALKAFFIPQAKWIEVCRQSCGGNGYSAFSGLSSYLSDFGALVPTEGDNTVLAQQTAKFLIKAMMKVSGGEQLDAPFDYLNNCDETYKATTIQYKARDLGFHLQLMKFATVARILKVSQKLSNAMGDGKTPEEAFLLHQN